ncbi:MAG: precorrin-3B C(17)-methyltransferase [Nitrospinota bacterium]|nr:precorrin-3B C(17)-methyltransferase [Nitrospinota bacterium]
MQRSDGGRGKGKLFVVGVGPGHPLDRTRRAEEALRQSDVVAGYSKYLDLVEDLCDGKELISTGMTKEVDRCRMALARAVEGHIVSLVSSGDAGIYGMAGLAMELAAAEGMDVEIEVTPGVSAANAAGALLGAPLALDFAAISLSDLLVPWEMIIKRLEAVAAADMACALYNPKSKKRVTQLKEAADIFLKSRPGSTPVGVCDSIGLGEQSVRISDLDNFQKEEIGMRTIIIIGCSETKIINGKMVTPRGYSI